MSLSARDKYLAAQVHTATPQRLRLMLIEGALRFARQSLEHWRQEGQREAAYNALVRCRDIVTELYGSIKPDGNPVARQVAAIYLFLFRLLAEAPLHDDPRRLEDAIRVLEEERRTWTLLCQQMPEAPAAPPATAPGCQEITAAGLDAIPPDPPAPEGLSFEA